MPHAESMAVQAAEFSDTTNFGARDRRCIQARRLGNGVYNHQDGYLGNIKEIVLDLPAAAAPTVEINAT